MKATKIADGIHIHGNTVILGDYPRGKFTEFKASGDIVSNFTGNSDNSIVKKDYVDSKSIIMSLALS